jgi:hypothetical protein
MQTAVSRICVLPHKVGQLSEGGINIRVFRALRATGFNEMGAGESVVLMSNIHRETE